MKSFSVSTRFLLGGLLAGLFSLNASATQIDLPDGPIDDAGYLLQIGLMRGHLLVGHELFRQGEREAAQTHAKHPADELYATLQPSFAERGVGGFAAELEAHAEAVGSGSEADVEAAYRRVAATILGHQQAVTVSPELVAQVVVDLVRVAAEEYAIGIVDGKPENAHEYQDAFGFTRIALQWAQDMAAGDQAAMFERIVARLEALDDMWPALVPPPLVEHTASRLYGAAAEIEILALGLAKQ